MKISYIILVLVGVFVITSTAFLLTTNIGGEDLQGENEKGTLLIGEKEFTVEVVDTKPLRQKGLSGREILAEGSGMLFVFDKSRELGFWMKDMNFPVDIIWFDETLTVVDVHERVEPSSFPEIFEPQTPAQYVLEINANLVNTLNISIGDKAVFSTL